MTQKEIEAKAKELKREYARNWKKKNPDKVKAATDRYWEKKARKALECEKDGGTQ